MATPSHIFRAYDIRGVVSTDLTPSVVEEIGRAFGSQCQDQGIGTVVIARDGRLSGPSLSEALARGVLATGVDVVDIGMVPTPVLYFATYHLNTGTGIMVTGSHNPPEYNGLKMMIDGETLYGDAIKGLYQRIKREAFHQGEGNYRQQDILNDYLGRIRENVLLERPLRIGIDCGNGVTGVAAPALYESLGCETHALFSEVDGSFPNHHPDPAEPRNLEALRSLVIEKKLDIGFAFDGDGDRIGVLDSEGQIIWPDRQMILFSKDLLNRNPGAKIIFDVKCSRHLPDAILSAGGKPEMWKTGHSFIKSRIKETGALLGGEMSGHIFFKERWFGFDDAIYSGARLLEILAGQPLSSQALFSKIPDSINTPEINIRFNEDGDHHEFMREFVEVATFPKARITRIDGFRADFDNGWGLVRASNTTPSLVIRFEADSDSAMSEIQDIFRKTINKVAPALDIPF